MKQFKMKKYIYLALSAALLLNGCYKPEIEELKSEIDDLRNTQIAPLSKQIESMSSSISDLKTLSADLKKSIASLETKCVELQDKISKVDSEMDATKQSLSSQIDESKQKVLEYLQTVKTSLEGKLADIEVVIANLKAKDTELDAKIDALRTYADETFASKTWLEGTFATIEAQNAIIADVTLIKGQIEALKNSAETLRCEMKQIIDTELEAACTELEANLAETVKELTKSYEQLLDETVESLSTSFSEALEAAIEKSENKIMSWVNEKLKDYYTIAEAEAKIAAFNALTGNVPEETSIQEEIEALDENIKEAAQRIKEAYTLAITEAIEASEGIISDMMADKISSLRNTVIATIENKVGELETEVQKLWNKMEELDGRIKTVEEQVCEIQKSIAVLNELQLTLKEYIEGIQKDLENADEENYNAVKAVIDELNDLSSGSGEGSLQSQIDALKTYIGELPQGEVSVSEWIKSSKETIEESFKLYYTVTKVDEIKGELEKAISDQGTQLSEISTRLSTIIEDSKSKIDGWISESLKPYYTSAEQQALLDALELGVKRLFTEGDENLQGQIDALRKELEDAQKELLESCQTLLETSITEMNAAVNKDLTSKLETIAASITTLSDKVSTLETTLAALKKSEKELNTEVNTLKSAVELLLAFISDTGYENLKAIVLDLRAKIAALPDSYGSLEKFNEMYKDVLGEDGQGGEGTIKYEVDKIEQLSEDLAAAESTLKSIEDFVKDDSGSFDYTTLKTIIDDIETRLSTIHTATIDGTMRERLDKLMELLYGEGGTPEEPAVDSLLGKLEVLSNTFLDLAEKFRSIAYVPVYTDGVVPLSYDIAKGIFTATLDFVVRPASVAKVLATATGCAMKYISTPTKSNTYNDFKTKAKFEVTDEEQGVLTATITVTKDEKATFVSGASTALFVATSKYDFVSDFIPLYLDGDSDVYYVTPSTLECSGKGGTLSATLTPLNRTASETLYDYRYYWVITTTDSWINCGEVQSDGSFSVTMSQNTSQNQRTAKVKLQYFKERKGKVTQSVETTQLSSDIYLTVKQFGRDPQTFVDFSPAALNFSFNGYFIDAQGLVTDVTTADVAVTTSDGLTDWTVSNNGVSWLAAPVKNENTATFSLSAKNTSGSDRTGKAKFTSMSGVNSEYSITQKARGEQTLVISPETVAEIPWTGLAKSAGRKISVTPSDKENDWTVSAASGSEWLKIDKHISEGYVLVYSEEILPAEYYGTGRSGKLVFKSSGTNHAEYEYTVKQAVRPAQTLTLNPEGGLNAVWNNISPMTLTVSSDDGRTDWSYSVISGGSDFNVDESQKASSGILKINAVAVNSSTAEKKCTLQFTGVNNSAVYTYIVTQSARSAQTLEFDPADGISMNWDDVVEKTLKVTPDDGLNDDWSYIVKSNDGFTIDASQKSSGILKIKANGENGSSADKKCVLEFTAKNNPTPYSYVITQTTRPEQSITGINPNTLTISADGTKYLNGSSWEAISGKTLSVSTSDGRSDWTLTGTPSWFTSWTKDGSNVKASGNATANSSWSNGKQTGNVTVKAHNGNSTMSCALTQNRPLTVTQTPSINEIEQNRTSRVSVNFTINSDSEWRTTSSSVGKYNTNLFKTTDITSNTYYTSKTVTASISQAVNQTTYIDITNKEGTTKYIKIVIKKGSKLSKSKITVTVVDTQN